MSVGLKQLLRPGVRWLFLGALVGCSSTAAGRKDADELRRELARLRQQASRTDNTLRDLENRIFLLEDRLETAATLAAKKEGVPRLPVVTKSPSVTTGEPLAMPPAQGAPMVPTGAGVVPRQGDEDVEVSYEGEAALPIGARPMLRLHESDRQEPMVPAEERGPMARRITHSVSGPTGFPDPAQVTDRIPVVPLPEKRATAPAAAPLAGVDPISLYKESQAALQRREHPVAIAGFERFLTQWPEHDFADNSQYWLAEAYYDQRDYGAALGEFRKVVKRYPSGNKAPDAMLKIGYCYAKLGELESARDVLSQIVEIYPTTSAAKLATKRLEEMRE
ncbi:MAG: tol-pal system protein YbgF [Deltaproteobacteria bacterium]|nr:tol-pal system protein YbgF [Deltaproteobacteria bacterium]